jgi:hypothetical protein
MVPNRSSSPRRIGLLIELAVLGMGLMLVLLVLSFIAREAWSKATADLATGHASSPDARRYRWPICSSAVMRHRSPPGVSGGGSKSYVPSKGHC